MWRLKEQTGPGVPDVTGAGVPLDVGAGGDGMIWMVVEDDVGVPVVVMVCVAGGATVTVLAATE
jgi:hypothetical protein